MLNIEQLESREVPANLIPGWSGPEMDIQAYLNDDGILDTAAVALSGGSAHVYAVDGKTGEVLLNTIAFSNDFQGGGYIAAIPGNGGGGVSHPIADSLLVVPGPGGGPVVDQFDFSSATGQLELASTFFAPYPESFRGGLEVNYGDANGDGRMDAVFLPGAGGGPQLLAVDLTNHDVLASFYVGPPNDESGDYAFEAAQGPITTPDHEQAIDIQQGPIVDDYATTEVWTFGGVNVTGEYAGSAI